MIARKLAAKIMKLEPVDVQRFSTGLHHYVYEVRFSGRDSIVLRMATPENRDAMVGAYTLSKMLKPLGVPLPEILAVGLDHEFPYLVLKRLPGTDLLHVISQLDDQQLEAIAGHVAAAQKITAVSITAERFGYAVLPEDAPHERWSKVLENHLARSSDRILQAGLFDAGFVKRVENLLNRLRKELEQQPATAFLHDTTTKNVIVGNNGTFAGIVDVDNFCFGDPRYAIALTKASLLNLGASVHYTNYWLAKSCHKDDHVFNFYVALFLLDFMSEHGQNFNGNIANSMISKRKRLETILTSTLQQINP